MRAAVAAGQAREQHRQAQRDDQHDSKWINEASRRDMCNTGARSSAILTGAGAVLSDDPHLTVRLSDEHRISSRLCAVLDPGLAAIARRHVREGSTPTLYHAPDAKPPRERMGLRTRPCGAGAGQGVRPGPQCCATARRTRRQRSARSGAGATLTGAFLAEGLVDELLLYVGR